MGGKTNRTIEDMRRLVEGNNTYRSLGWVFYAANDGLAEYVREHFPGVRVIMSRPVPEFEVSPRMTIPVDATQPQSLQNPPRNGSGDRQRGRRPQRSKT